MKSGGRYLWNLGVPLLSRGINFIVLPFTLILFDYRNFVSLTYASMLVAGISIIASLGNAPRLLKKSIDNSLSIKLTCIILIQLIVFWMMICTFASTLSLDLPQNFSKLDKTVFLLVLIEGIVMGFTNDIPFKVFQGKKHYSNSNSLSFLLIILLGPVRLLITWFLGPTLLLWITLAVIFRIVILIVALLKVREIISVDKTPRTRLTQFIKNLLQPTIFGHRNFLILLSLNMWMLGSLDRLLIPTLLSPKEGAAYQIAYACASTIGLISMQVMYLQTHNLMSLDKDISIHAIARIISTFRFIVLVSLPILPIFFWMFFHEFKHEYLMFLIGISFSQFLWSVVQVQLLLITSKLSKVRSPLVVTLLAIISQIVLIKLIVGENLKLLLPVIIILGCLICFVFFNFINHDFGEALRLKISRRSKCEVLATLIVLSIGIFSQTDNIVCVEIILFLYSITLLLSKKKQIVADWKYSVHG